ncbi:MAG: helix-turn-helix domain-containing protein [Acidimicrobiales bacterium]
MDFRTVLAEARQRSGLTIRQLGARAATSHSAVAAYESGAKAPNTATLLRLLAACGFVLEPRLVPIAQFEDRVRRGRELIEVLDLADQFPRSTGAGITARFGTR